MEEKHNLREAGRLRNSHSLCFYWQHFVGNNYLPVKKMGYLYRFDAAESKYGNEIAPSPITCERGVFKLKKTKFQ